MPCPAMSGAVPPLGSYIPKYNPLPVDWPRLALANIPRDPAIIAISSLSISPNRFGARITSNSFGLRINCIAALSTYKWSNLTSGY